MNDDAQARAQRWTPAQLDAIRTTGCGLLVSAAAGSGKTSVLAERCAHLVCSAPSRCGVDQLLVVTFTEAAAAEMKARIEDSLRRRMAGSADEHCRRQLALLDHAMISTVHGFCLWLLRQHFHRLELNPDFRVLDADEAMLMRLDTVQDLFLDRYEHDPDGSFGALVDCYSAGDDARLGSLVVALHELLQSLVDPERWTARASQQIVEAAARPLEESDLGRSLLGSLRDRLGALADDARSAIAALGAMHGFEAYVAHLQSLLTSLGQWQSLLATQGYDALGQAIRSYERPRLPTIRGDMVDKALARALVDPIHDAMGADATVRSQVVFTSDEWRAGLAAIAPHAQAVLSLVAGFGQRYAAAKERVRGLDFADLERLALKLLGDRAQTGLVPSAVARWCHRRFEHVLVDEYQDINEVQDAILQLVSRECIATASTPPNLFCVGDVKQSIYRFRLAEPRRFLQRQALFRQPGAIGRAIDLQANFRSRRPLLDAINRFFERVMTASAVDIEYDLSQRLHAQLAYPDAPGRKTFAGAPIELLLVPEPEPRAHEEDHEAQEDPDRELDRAHREAAIVAHRIASLMEGGDARHVVMDRGPDGHLSPRPIEYRDIVVLLRSMRYQADTYAQALRDRNIPSHAASGMGYFQATEIRDMVELLALLDNQRQDIPMAAVLRSPLARLPDAADALARIRIAYPADDKAGVMPFSLAVARYAQEHDDPLATWLRGFLAQLEEWRRWSGRVSVADLVWRIYEDTGYLAYVTGLPNGQQRVANLLDLHARARQFSTFSRQGLARFLEFLRSLQAQAQVPQASELGQADNVVRIMSIHSAKGLEFPVVVLPELGKLINMADCAGDIVADRQAMLGLSVVDLQRRIRYPSLASTLVKERLKQQTLAEELRVLYVAMTRAREHLVLIGTCRAGEIEQWTQRWRGHRGALPRQAILSARRMLDWIGPALSVIDDPQAFVVQTPALADALGQSANADAPKRPQAPQHLLDLAALEPTPPVNPIVRQVVRRLATPYPFERFCTLAAVTSVTAWAKQAPGAADIAPPEQAPLIQTLLPPPAFLRDRQSLVGAERGTAIHVAMQHLDFSRPCDEGDLRRQIDTMVARQFLTPAQAQAVDMSAIQWFLGTDVGALVRRNAGRLLSELPFDYALEPHRLGVADGPDPMDRVILRGRIDLMIPHDDGFAALDWKSDQVQGTALRQRIELYRSQVSIYREAFEAITGRKVTSAWLVFLHPRHIEAIQ